MFSFGRSKSKNSVKTPPKKSAPKPKPKQKPKQKPKPKTKPKSKPKLNPKWSKSKNNGKSKGIKMEKTKAYTRNNEINYAHLQVRFQIDFDFIIFFVYVHIITQVYSLSVLNNCKCL